MSAVPVTSFTVSGKPVSAGTSENDFIGSVATLNLSFYNSSSTDPGYVPFVDLVLPATPNGVTFGSATYLRSAITSQSVIFDANGHATHPFLKDANGVAVVINGPPGATLVVLTLPFGSFTPGQTPADIVVKLNVSHNAIVGQPLDVTATGGFAFGNSPTGVTASNPPIVGAQTDYNVIPQIVVLSTVYVGPEQETATGPSYPRDWDSVATIAPGETLNSLVLTQKLPDGAVFLPSTSALLYGAGTAAGTITYDAATNTVTGTFAQAVTGGVAGSPPTLQAAFYVTEAYTKPADGGAILDPATGSFAPLTDTSNLTAVWHSTNPANPANLVAGPVSNTITAKSIAIQKGVVDLTHGSNATQPHDTLQYSLNGQVSNYFDVNTLVIQDTLGDGQTFLADYNPTITIADLGQTLYSGTVAANEFTVTGKAADGSSLVTFDVSKILADHGKPTDLNGGTAASPAPATADVTFETTIDPNYVGSPGPVVSSLVDQGDSIGDTVTFSGKVAATGDAISDNSSASITLPTNTVAKSIYAVNGVLVTGPVHIQAGDLVTYDLQLTTPLTSTQRVTLSDYLPLPTFKSTDPGADGGISGFTFIDGVTSAAPAVGTAEFGPADTFRAAQPGDVPTITTNATANSLTFDFGNYTEATTNYPGNVADVLYTVRAGDGAFADGLLLTNQVTSKETNSFGVVTMDNAIVQLTLGQPELKIEKAVVATSDASAVFHGSHGPDTYSAPGSAGTRFSGGAIDDTTLAAAPLGDSLTGIVAGDSVSFAVVVQNTGHGPNGAFNVILHDTIPTGFDAPTNVRVTDGAGNVLAYTDLGGGLFGNGLELTDNGAKGALATDDPSSGANVAVITYDATASVNVPVPNYDLHNVAAITSYAAEAGGINHVAFTPAGDVTASSDVYTAKPQFAKAVVATSALAPTLGLPNTGDLAIGETATYDITLTLSKGTAGNVAIADLLPSGAAGELDLVSAVVKSIGSDVGGSALAVGATSNGPNGAFDFGALSDGSNGQGAADQVVVEVTARASNVGGNVGGKTLTNTATLTETDPNNPTGAPYTQTATASELVVEPELKLVKSANNTTPQGGDVVTYTLHYVNGNDGHSASAFNTVINDTLSQLGTNAVFDAGTVQILGSSTAAANIVTGNGAGDTGVSVHVGEIDPGQVVDISFQTTVLSTAVDGTAIPNTATLTAGTLVNNDPNARTETTSGSTTLTVRPATITKTIIAGSDPNIAAPKLTAGETGTYQVVLTLPHGASPNFSLVDYLPNTMSYVAGTETVVSVGSNISGYNGSPTVTTGVYAGNTNYNQLLLGFGNLQDNGSGPSTSADQIVIDYQALVLPIAANPGGASDTNYAGPAVNGTVVSSTSATAMIVAPLLSLTKTANLNGALPQAGSDVTYTLVVKQNGSSPAYGISLSDVLPGDETYDPGSLTASGNASASITGSTITLTDAQLLVSDAPVTVTYKAHLTNTVTPGEQLVNTATVNYNSEPTGGYAETPVTANATVPVDLLPTEVKSVLSLSNGFSASSVVTGETVVYKLLSTLGFGTQHFRLNDALPSGLTFLSATVASIGADVSGGALTLGAVAPANGTTNFDFGTVVATPGAGSADQVEVDVTAIVGNVHSGTAIANAASALTSAPGSNTIGLETGSSTAPTLTVVKSSLSGTVFTDNNNDGVADGADSGLAGVTVRLLDGNGVATGATATTDGSGNYQFGELNLGNYSVQVVPPAGDVFSPVGGNANPALDSIVDASGRIAAVSMQPGANTPNQNAGLYVPASLSGTVFNDLNADGVIQPGDFPVAGNMVTLFDQNGHTLATTTTDSTGNYNFANLPPGTYSVRVAGIAGETFSPAGANANPALDSIVAGNGQTSPVTLTSGQSARFQSAGVFGPGSLSGTVFTDNNDDGVGDGADQALAGVSVRLLDSTGHATGATAVTDANGNYSFTGLHPANYEVQVTAPAGDAFAVVGGNANPALDSIVGSTGATSAAAVNSNTNTPNQNAGVYVPVTVAGIVFTDQNADGVRQAGDAAIAGDTVTLLNGGAVASTTTNANGAYSFAGLAPGSYTVAVTDPAGDRFSPVGTDANPAIDSIVNGAGTTPGITLSSGQSAPNENAGAYVPASLSGHVFVDPNADGQQTGTEPSDAGIVVRLLGAGGQPTGASTVTDANGNYSFTGLTPGSYAVQVVAPAGNSFAPPGSNANPALDSIVGSNGQTAPVTLVSGGAAINQNAGLYRSGSLSGKVFVDANDNGVSDGADAGLGGVSVQLLDGSSHVTGVTATTDASGHYSFGNLTPGNYAVQVVAPAGDGFSPVGGNVNPAIDSIVGASGSTAPAAVLGGQDTPNQNAGVYVPVSLSGTVFTDQNADGVKQAGDTPVVGDTVTLLDGSGHSTGVTAKTDASGNYSFTGLKPGTYSVTVTDPTGDRFSPVGANANRAVDSIVNGSGTAAAVTLASGQSAPNQNAGVYVPASLSGAVFTDQNADGVKQAGDAPIAGDTVTLLNSAGQSTGVTTTTDANGNYSFTGLTPGSYAVAVTDPAGDRFSPVGTNANPAVDSIVNGAGKTATVTLTSGRVLPNQNAGAYAPASLTGNVFNDVNADGAHEGTEGSLAGLTVQLLDGNGHPIAGATATTDANGNYGFTGLTPGSYAVQVTPPPNDKFSPHGNSPTLPDSTVGSTGTTPTVTLVSGQTVNQVSGAYLPTPKLSVTKTANATLADGGETITYTVVVAQAAGSTGAAYNVAIGDLLAPGETLVSGTETTTAGSVTEINGALRFAAGTIGLAGPAVTITYQALVKGDVVNGQPIANTANLTYGSLPGGGVPFTGASTATFGVQLVDQLAKTLVNSPLDQGGTVAPGTVVTFDVTATLDIGAQHLVLSDLLPAGLTYLSSKLDSLGSVAGSSIAVGTAGTFDASSNVVTFGVGDVDVPIGAANHQVVFEVTAQVAAGAVVGSTITNTGKLTATTPANGYGVPAGMPEQVLTATQSIGVVAPGSIGSHAFLDAHCDGTDDFGDPAFSGVTVKLFDGAGHYTGVSTTTDGQGMYGFNNLAAGQYQVQFTAPNGTAFAQYRAGADNTVNSDAGANGFSEVFTLTAGEIDNTHSVGLYLTGGYANSHTTYLDGTTTAYGSTGPATIVGGPGSQNDIIAGGTGDNILLGGMGTNTIEGGSGNNIIVGGCGTFAQIQGLGTNDFIFGGPGDDLIQAHDGNEFVAAGVGNQQISGSGQHNTFIANANTGTFDYKNGVFSNFQGGDDFVTSGTTASLYEKGDGLLTIRQFTPSQGDTLTVYGYAAPTATAYVDGFDVLYFGPNAAIRVHQPSGSLNQGGVYPGVTFQAALPTAPLLTVGEGAHNFLTLTQAGASGPIIGPGLNPTVSNTAAGQAGQDNATLAPFAAVLIDDPTPGETETVRVTPSSSQDGQFSFTTGSIDHGGYTVTGMTQQVTAAIQALTYTPTAHQVLPGQSVATGFTVFVSDTSGHTTTDTGTSIVVAAIDVPPTISGAQSGQSVADTSTAQPFAHVVVGDPDNGLTETVTVTLSSTANGTLSNLGNGMFNATTGTYTTVGTAAAVTANLSQVVFTPVAHEAAIGSTVATGFGISVTDSAGGSVSDTSTSVAVAQSGGTVVQPGSGNVVTMTDSSRTYVGGDANMTVNGPPNGGGNVTLGNGNDTVTMSGYGNTVAVGAGNDTTDVGLGSDVFTAAGGNQGVTLHGYNDMVFLNGTGHSVVSGGAGSSQFTTAGGSASITLNGYANTVTTGGANDAIADGTGYTVFNIGAVQAGQAGGMEVIANFQASAGSLINLIHGAAGGQTAASVFASLTTDASGNAKLDLNPFGGNGGSVVFAGLTPGQLHQSNFQVS